jgi:hypothetical protein
MTKPYSHFARWWITTIYASVLSAWRSGRGRTRPTSRLLASNQSTTWTYCRVCNGVSEPWTRGRDACSGFARSSLNLIGARYWILGQFAGAAASMRRVAPAGMSCANDSGLIPVWGYIQQLERWCIPRLRAPKRGVRQEPASASQPRALRPVHEQPGRIPNSR